MSTGSTATNTRTVGGRLSMRAAPRGAGAAWPRRSRRRPRRAGRRPGRRSGPSPRAAPRGSAQPAPRAVTPPAPRSTAASPAHGGAAFRRRGPSSSATRSATGHQHRSPGPSARQARQLAAPPPRVIRIPDLPSLVHRFLLGTVEALDRLRRCHPGVVDGSPSGVASTGVAARRRRHERCELWHTRSRKIVARLSRPAIGVVSGTPPPASPLGEPLTSLVRCVAVTFDGVSRISAAPQQHRPPPRHDRPSAAVPAGIRGRHRVQISPTRSV